MVTKPLLATIFPGVIVENFDIVSIQHCPEYEEIHIHLDGKKTVPAEFFPSRDFPWFHIVQEDSGLPTQR